MQVLEAILTDAGPQRAAYDEVTAVIGVLTAECNEFRRHCIQKGVSPEACPTIESTPNVEDIVGALYGACKRCLKRPSDMEALDARKNYLLRLINDTKLEIRTNTNRLNCLCSSVLFYLGRFPQALTSQIRPVCPERPPPICFLAHRCNRNGGQRPFGRRVFL